MFRRVVPIVAALVGCGAVAPTAVVAQATTPDATITLRSQAFNPSVVEVPTSGSGLCVADANTAAARQRPCVDFVHDDGATAHTITIRSEAGALLFDSHPNCVPSAPTAAACFSQGDLPIRMVFETAGTYSLSCRIHPAMTGQVRVRGRTGGEPQPPGAPIPPPTTAPPAPPPPPTAPPAPATTAAPGDPDATIPDDTDDTTDTTFFFDDTTTIATTTTTTTAAVEVASPASDDDEAPAWAQALAVLLLAAVIAGLIPGWRRLT